MGSSLLVDQSNALIAQIELLRVRAFERMQTMLGVGNAVQLCSHQRYLHLDLYALLGCELNLLIYNSRSALD